MAHTAHGSEDCIASHSILKMQMEEINQCRGWLCMFGNSLGTLIEAKIVGSKVVVIVREVTTKGNELIRELFFGLDTFLKGSGVRIPHETDGQYRQIKSLGHLHLMPKTKVDGVIRAVDSRRAVRTIPKTRHLTR